MVKKNDIIEFMIEDRSFPNKGYGQWEGQRILVKNTIPGQKVSARISKKKNGMLEAIVLDILEKSPLETEEGCSHFGLCGGCAYQTMSYEEEQKLKEKQVWKLLNQAGIKINGYEGIVSAPNPKGYRNKCEFSFGDEEKGGALALGMRKRQSYYEVVTLKDCNIVDQDYLDILHAVLHFFQEKQIPFYHKMSHEGQLRHLVVRKGAYTGEILINLVTTTEYTFSLEELKEVLLSLKLKGVIIGILHTLNDSVADVVKKEKMKTVYGKDFFTEHLLGLQFKISPFSFFQTNTKGAETLYHIVRNFAGETKNKIIFDLYCGTGTIAQIISEKANHVYGIEIVEEAVEAAKENAEANGIKNCTFLAGDVLKKVEELEEKPDLLIVDPPREGIHPKAINKIIAFQAPEIIYVSCKPTSLARDLQIFQENGYQVQRMQLVDQFCRTVHIECVVLLVKCF